MSSISDPDAPKTYEIDARLRVLEAAIPSLVTKADITAVWSDIKGWMIATILTVVGTIAALLFGFVTLARPFLPAATAQTPAAAQPIIIYAAPPAR